MVIGPGIASVGLAVPGIEVGASSGNTADEVIMKYIEEQGHEPPDGDFKIDGNDL